MPQAIDKADEFLGHIYEGTAHIGYPDAKFLLRRYNQRTGEVEYIGWLPGEFTVDTIRDTYGGGKFYIEARVQGQYVAKAEVSINGRAHPDQARPDQTDTPGVGSKVPDPTGEAELNRSLAQAIRYKSITGILNPDKPTNGEPPKLDPTLQKILEKQLEKMNQDPLERFSESAKQYQALKDLFGKGKGTKAAPVTLESAVAESVPEILDLLKQKYLSPSSEKKPEPTNGKDKDMEFVISRIYQMVKENESPAKGAAMIISVLPAKDVMNLVKTSPEKIAKNILLVRPDMSDVLESEAGNKWLQEFHSILRKNILSRKVSPAPKQKSDSSGEKSGKVGETPTLSGRQRTSSASSRSGIRKPRRGQSTTGSKTIRGTRTRK